RATSRSSIGRARSDGQGRARPCARQLRAAPQPPATQTAGRALSLRQLPGQFRRMSLEDFRLLRDIVYEHAGLVYDESAMMLFDRRLGERLEALGLPNYQAYYKYLRFDARNQQEMEEAVERLTTKETYFFRQASPLRAF